MTARQHSCMHSTCPRRGEKNANMPKLSRGLLSAPRPILAASALIAISLLGDSAIYVILPVAYAQRGLTPFAVGLVLSVNRWVRLFTNVPAAWLLGTKPVRQIFCVALAIGASCSLVYAATTNLFLLLLARAVWGSCWSIIRLTGLMTLTDCCEAGLASEDSLGQLSGVHAGLSRVGSAAGLGLGGLGLDVLGFEPFFTLVGLFSLAMAPLALGWALDPLPQCSHTAARRLEERREKRAQASACSTFSMSAAEWRLAFLAFSSTCAGQGMVMSTLGVLLAVGSSSSAAAADDEHGALASSSSPPPPALVDLGPLGHAVPLASATGAILALRWVFELCALPLFGKLIDRLGQRLVCPAFFALCALSGAVGFNVLRGLEGGTSELGGVGGHGSMLPLVVSILFFFVAVAGADLCVNALGVAQRQTTVFVIGADLGAAMGPVLGYTVLQMRLPPSTILLTQATLHAAAACVSCCACGGAQAQGGPQLLRAQAADPDESAAQLAMEMEGAEEEEMEMASASASAEGNTLDIVNIDALDEEDRALHAHHAAVGAMRARG